MLSPAALLPALTALALALAAGPAAGACRAADKLQWRGATLRLENDMFTGTDRNYTNGVALALVAHDLDGAVRPDCLPPGPRLLARVLERVDPGFWADAVDGAARNVVLRFGQSMYTPEDKARTDLVRDDRPYAGLLYASVAWNRRAALPGTGWEMLDARELTLGIIGPWSLARQSQDFVHRARGIERFQGWDHQLRNEPALQGAIERKYKRAATGAVHPGFATDFTASHALRLGTIETSVSAGMEWRAGWNLPNDFGSYPIRPGAENRPPSAAVGLRDAAAPGAAAPRPGAHAFLTVEARAVARDFSFDGNLFRASHHVTRRPWVAELAAGISGQWRVGVRGMRLAVMRVWRTREFAEQRGHHAFGSIALSMEL